jgi:hypothetical protein
MIVKSQLIISFILSISFPSSVTRFVLSNCK